MKITDKPDKRGGTRVDFHCFAGCDWKDVKAELVRQGLIEPWRNSLHKRHTLARAAQIAKAVAEQRRREQMAAEAADDEAKRIAFALKFWNQAEPIAGTLGGTYLRVHRSFEFAEGAFDHCVRYHAAKMMLVELMTDPVSGEPCGVQRVFLDALGRKIERKMLGRAGICRISDDDSVTHSLHLCEGFEDGIKIYCDGLRPVWATLSAGLMKSFPVLGGIDCLNLIPDVDEVGKAAAEACAVVWRKAKREVCILDDYFS